MVRIFMTFHKNIFVRQSLAMQECKYSLRYITPTYTHFNTLAYLKVLCAGPVKQKILRNVGTFFIDESLCFAAIRKELIALKL